MNIGILSDDFLCKINDGQHLVGQPGSDAYPARLPFAIVDNYRHELANLGR